MFTAKKPFARLAQFGATPEVQICLTEDEDKAPCYIKHELQLFPAVQHLWLCCTSCSCPHEVKKGILRVQTWESLSPIGVVSRQGPLGYVSGLCTLPAVVAILV